VTLSVPAEPIPIKAANSVALVYELHIANVGTQPLRLERISVRESATADSTPIATYERREIERSVKLIGPRGAAAPKALSPGVRAVFFVWLAFDSIEKVPRTLSHTVTFAGGDTARADTVPVRAPADLVVGPPVGAGDWWIGLGPSNTSEHRRAVIRVGDDPEPHLAQRFGIDWVKLDARGEYARDRKGRTNADWYGYGEPVRAVADARVVAMTDGIPDNTPGENSRAVSMTVSTVLGNYVVLDLGPASGSLRRYALYGHFKPATVQVHVGDVVNRGQVLGSIGNSGNSDGPHLHFHVTEAPDAARAPLRAEGIPFMLDAFEVVAHDPARVSQRALLTPLGLHQNALPVEGDVIRIGERQR
jgi:murein DD-endopeptidase MepM/ murein hydrolase activator NlpD